MLFSTLFSVAALLIAEASAHGAVESYVIDGTAYPGYQGFSPASGGPTIQRQWPDYNPTLKITDPKVMCNGGTSAALVANATGGSVITAKWKQWTHQQGPVMVWLYKCPGDIKACDGSGDHWFKIDQMGMTAPPLKGSNWGTAIVYSKLAWTSTLPKSLAPGFYLIRHELIAQHQANNPQFYAECAQLHITGSGTGVPPASLMTHIPGYAPQSDPGVTINIDTGTATTYTCPGPAVWTG